MRSLADIESAIILGALSGEYEWSVRWLNGWGATVKPDKRRAHLFPTVEHCPSHYLDTRSLCGLAELVSCHALEQYMAHNHHAKTQAPKSCYKCLGHARRILVARHKENTDAS